MFDIEKHGVNNKIEVLQRKLKLVNKLKLCTERQMYKLHNSERYFREELHSTKSEIELLSQQLEDLKDKISDIKNYISKTEIQKTAAKITLDSYISKLNDHKKGFDEMFDAERKKTEHRNKAIRDKLAELQELQLQKQSDLDKEQELQANYVATLEEETVAIERESTVLKKRNAAIMLKLRRKLLEAEDARRTLLNRQALHDDNKL